MRNTWKHDEKNVKEAWSRWKWKRYPCFRKREGEELEREAKAERETDRDLKKSIQQLLADFHMEAESAMKGADINTQHVLNANKRMVGMMARVARENRRMSLVMCVFTAVIMIFTIILAYITILN